MHFSRSFTQLNGLRAEMKNPHVTLIQSPKAGPGIGISSNPGSDNYAVPFPQVQHVCNNLAQMPGCTRVEVEMNNANLETGAFELFAAAYGADNEVFDRRAIKPPRSPSAATQPAEAGQQL